jgi:hypothetical protein
MNYAKIIREDVFRGIDDTLYVLMLSAGENAAAEADVMGLILKQEITRYTDDAIKRLKKALKGVQEHDAGRDDT